MSNQEQEILIPEGLDCYGLLYDAYIHPCRDECSFRFSCKEELKKRFDAEGQKEIENKQRRIVMEHNNLDRNANKKVAEKPDNENSITPEVSEIVSAAMEVCKKLELKPVNRKGYIAFKIDSRNILALTRLRAKSLKGVIKFIYSKNIEDFPEPVRAKLLPERVGGYCCADIETPEELEQILKIYLEQFKAQK